MFLPRENLSLNEHQFKICFKSYSWPEGGSKQDKTRVRVDSSSSRKVKDTICLHPRDVIINIRRTKGKGEQDKRIIKISDSWWEGGKWSSFFHWILKDFKWYLNFFFHHIIILTMVCVIQASNSFSSSCLYHLQWWYHTKGSHNVSILFSIESFDYKRLSRCRHQESSNNTVC